MTWSNADTYIRRVSSSVVWPFGVMLDNASICDPVWTHCLNRGQKIDFGVLNWRASKGNSVDPQRTSVKVTPRVNGVTHRSWRS
jgi:hypothetical protein